MKRKDRRRHEAAGGGPNVSKRTGMSEPVREAARSEDLIEAIDAVKKVVTVRVGGARVELGALREVVVIHEAADGGRVLRVLHAGR